MPKLEQIEKDTWISVIIFNPLDHDFSVVVVQLCGTVVVKHRALPRVRSLLLGKAPNESPCFYASHFAHELQFDMGIVP